MAPPFVRDVIAWICSIPASLALFACLSLPQVADCNGHVKTAAEAGTSPLIVALALIALVPLAWQLRFLRGALATVVGMVAALAVLSNVLVIPVAIYCAFRRPWRSPEHFVAFACCCCALAFVVWFPLFGLFSTWLDGAMWAWGSAWVVLVGSCAWSSAARERAREAPPFALELLVPEPADAPSPDGR